MNGIKLTLVPHRPALVEGYDNETHVLVRVTAPPLPAGLKRKVPLHLALVLDRSGSMSGPALKEAKRCAQFVVDGLQADDRASLVAFDDEVSTLVPAQPVGDGQALRSAIASIAAGGSTHLHGGWFTGAESLAPHATGSVLSRVIVLSDGCANQGLQEEDAIASQCAELAASGITTSTYGLGRGFRESLMQAMARSGGGSAYYGETADDLMDPFREELALINALVARNLTLQVKAAPGVEVKLLNDYPSAGANGWHLPNLAYDADAWALLSVRVPKSAASAGDAPLVEASVAGVSLEGEALAIEPAALALRTVGAVAFEALAKDDLVARRLEEITTASETRRAREAARRGEWNKVDELLGTLREKVAGSPWLRGVVGELEGLARRRDTERFAKEAAYTSTRMVSRLSATRESADGLFDGAMFLQRKVAQGKTRRRPEDDHGRAPPKA